MHKNISHLKKPQKPFNRGIQITVALIYWLTLKRSFENP